MKKILFAFAISCIAINATKATITVYGSSKVATVADVRGDRTVHVTCQGSSSVCATVGIASYNGGGTDVLIGVGETVRVTIPGNTEVPSVTGVLLEHNTVGDVTRLAIQEINSLPIPKQ